MDIFKRFRREQQVSLVESGEADRQVRKVREAWTFIYDAEPPDYFERGVRAWLLQEVPATRIIGAMTIAAMKPTLGDADQWAYLCGVLRNERRQEAS